ncbi:MAG: ABC transporter substrate-binding protein, partial [Actinomycetaceae bacterium]
FYVNDATLPITTNREEPAIIPGVLSGDLQFGSGNAISLIVAHATDLPVVGVAPSNVAGADTCQIMVTPDSPITEADDLVSQTVAVNTLNNLGDVSVRAAVEAEGGDASAVNFVELGFPEMQGALERGDVDAIWTCEPFVAVSRDAGAVSVISPYDVMTSDLISTIFTSEELITSNPDLVDRFTEAAVRSFNYSDEYPDVFRESLSRHTDIDPELISQIELADWSRTELTMEDFEGLVGYVERFGLVEDEVDLTGIIRED